MTDKKPFKLPPRAEAIDKLRQLKEDTTVHVGDTMPDGTVYAGISPTTGKPLYAAPADAPKTMSHEEATAYATALEVGGRRDFRLPDKAELQVIFNNKNKGALKDTFNLWGATNAKWYWTCEDADKGRAWTQGFNRGAFLQTYRDTPSSVRCVR
jgi:hypothetical protein